MTQISPQLRWIAPSLLILLGGAVPAAAQGSVDRTHPPPSGDTVTLDLAAVRRLASERNPVLTARRREADAAAGRYRQARVYPHNPEVSLRSAEVGAGRTLDAYEGEVSQELEWAGQWGLRRDVGRFEAERASLLAGDAERRIVADASVVFLEALAAEERLRLAEQIETLNMRLLNAAGERLEAGAISELEMNLARIEAARAQARVLAEHRNARSARLELRRTLALPDDQPLRLAADLSDAPRPGALDRDSLVSVALARRPDADAARREVEAARASRDLAGRERWPNLTLAVPFERLGGPGSDLLGVSVGMAVPLWNRDQGTLDATRAEVARARADLDATELAVRAEVDDALQRFASAAEEEALARASMRDPARANQALLEEAFRSGKIDLPTLLLVRNQLLDAELAYWNSWLQYRAELVRLDAAVAEPTTDEAPGDA
jgi:cobalt-zinc-cadmium efflux system outer membrane protein